MKNQHLTVQNKRRRLEWWSSVLERLGETKRLGSISQDTRFSKIQWSPFSLFQSALQTIFSIRFPVVFRIESRGVFLVVLVIWCCLPRKICTMFLLLLSCSRPITHGDDALASRRELLQNCSSATSSGPASPFSSCASSPTIRTRGSVGGLPCLAIVLAHVFLAIFGGCTALPPKHSVETSSSVLLLVETWSFSHACHSFSACHSQGFGCRAALQRPMRVTMTRHRFD